MRSIAEQLHKLGVISKIPVKEVKVEKPEQLDLNIRNCDWCGKNTECNQLSNTHYMVCLNCAIDNIKMRDLINKH